MLMTVHGRLHGQTLPEKRVFSLTISEEPFMNSGRILDPGEWCVGINEWKCPFLISGHMIDRSPDITTNSHELNEIEYSSREIISEFYYWIVLIFFF